MQKEIEIDVRALIKYLTSRWINIAIAVFMTFMIAFGISAVFITPIYESQSMIYITMNGSEGTVVQNMLSTLQAGNALTADYKTLAVSKPVLEQTKEELDLPETYSQLTAKVSTENPENTRILILKVRDKSPARAKKIVDTLTKIERSKIKDIMGMNKPSIMQWGDMPTAPVTSSPIKNAALCSVVALFLILGVMTVGFIQNDNIVSPDDIENSLGIKNLAEVPMIPELDQKTKVQTKGFKKVLKKILGIEERESSKSKKRG